MKKVEREIGNIVKAIMGGFEAEELKSAYDVLKVDKTNLLAQVEIERRKQAQRIEIDESSVKRALGRISADICEGKPIEEYKRLFSSFVERVEVFEDYVVVVLNIFDMINVRTSRGSGVIKEKPPLDFHQMVVWNGGDEENRTPVRKLLAKVFSECSYCTKIPLTKRPITGFLFR